MPTTTRRGVRNRANGAACLVPVRHAITEVGGESSCCGKRGVDLRFQPAVMLHPFGHVADDADVVTLLQLSGAA